MSGGDNWPKPTNAKLKRVCSAGRSTSKKWAGKLQAVLQEHHTEAQQKWLRSPKKTQEATLRKRRVFNDSTGVHLLHFLS